MDAPPASGAKPCHVCGLYAIGECVDCGAPVCREDAHILDRRVRCAEDGKKAAPVPAEQTRPRGGPGRPEMNLEQLTGYLTGALDESVLQLCDIGAFNLAGVLARAGVPVERVGLWRTSPILRTPKQEWVPGWRIGLVGNGLPAGAWQPVADVFLLTDGRIVHNLFLQSEIYATNPLLSRAVPRGIREGLVDGIDPYTGQILPPE